MIKRIQSIKNLGRFLSCDNTVLGQVVLIYGPNCYGKSTLSDLFRSLEKNDSYIINKRKSINITEPVNICLTFLAETEIGEKKLTFNEIWNKNNFNYSLEIFDSKFIDENVFTGLNILRSNKENLTHLIIGSENVKFAGEIEKLKKAERELITQYGSLEYLLKEKIGIFDIGLTFEEFISVEKLESIENIKNENKQLEEKKVKLTKQLSEAKEILDLEKPQVITNIETPLSIIEEIKTVINRKFEDLDTIVYEKFKNHINKHIINKDGNEERWIRLGVERYLNDKQNSSCPFCGQQLKNADELIKTYRAIFSEEYQKYYSEIENKLSNLLLSFDSITQNLDELPDILKINLIIIQKYEKYFEENDNNLFKKIVNNDLEKMAKELLVNFEEKKEKITNLIDEKFKKPFESINFEIDDDFSIQFESVETAINLYNNIVEETSIIINKLHNKLENLENLKKDILETDNKIKNNDRLIKRYELSFDIEKYLTLKKLKDEKTQEREHKQIELEEKINRFSEEYFHKTTEVLKSLGSFDFEIGQILTKRGSQPVFEPIIKFKGTEVSNEMIPFVFSDADRRALAFSFFLTKIYKKSEDDLKKTIVILDDPVTSFDDNRIDQTVMKIQELVAMTKQIIVLAHHSSFLKHLNTTLKKNASTEILFYEIIRGLGGSNFSIVEEPDIRFDPYAREFEKLTKFIKGDDSLEKEVRLFLRIFLEEEIKWRYRKQIKDSNISVKRFGDLIVSFKDKKIISNQVAEKIFNLNSLPLLNQEHHVVSSSTPDNTRNIATQIINFIFTEINPDPNF
jgi:wobble nucleotide-excising tRNase